MAKLDDAETHAAIALLEKWHVRARTICTRHELTNRNDIAVGLMAEGLGLTQSELMRRAIARLTPGELQDDVFAEIVDSLGLEPDAPSEEILDAIEEMIARIRP